MKISTYCLLLLLACKTKCFFVIIDYEYFFSIFAIVKNKMKLCTERNHKNNFEIKPKIEWIIIILYRHRVWMEIKIKAQLKVIARKHTYILDTISHENCILYSIPVDCKNEEKTTTTAKLCSSRYYT